MQEATLDERTVIDSHNAPSQAFGSLNLWLFLMWLVEYAHIKFVIADEAACQVVPLSDLKKALRKYVPFSGSLHFARHGVGILRGWQTLRRHWLIG